jgi:hypothetical protein
MAAMRLQNMVTTSSRARIPAVWIRHTSSVNRLSRPTSRNSAASATAASPAKCAIFPGGIPASHTSVGPNSSNQRNNATCCFNRVTVAFGAG